MEAYWVPCKSSIAEDLGLKNQLLRAIFSIASNIAEGSPEFHSSDL